MKTLSQLDDKTFARLINPFVREAMQQQQSDDLHSAADHAFEDDLTILAFLQKRDQSAEELAVHLRQIAHCSRCHAAYQEHLNCQEVLAERALKAAPEQIGLDDLKLVEKASTEKTHPDFHFVSLDGFFRIILTLSERDRGATLKSSGNIPLNRVEIGGKIMEFDEDGKIELAGEELESLKQAAKFFGWKDLLSTFDGFHRAESPNNEIKVLIKDLSSQIIEILQCAVDRVPQQQLAAMMGPAETDLSSAGDGKGPIKVWEGRLTPSLALRIFVKLMSPDKLEVRCEPSGSDAFSKEMPWTYQLFKEYHQMPQLHLQGTVSELCRKPLVLSRGTWSLVIHGVMGTCTIPFHIDLESVSTQNDR